MEGRSIRYGALASALGLLCAAGTLLAATPPSGTLSVANPTLTFTSGPHTGENVEADCEANPCDEYALTVDLPPDYATTNPSALITVELEYTVPGDLDLRLLDGTDTQVADSGEPPGLPEYMDIPAGSGTRPYTVVVIPFATAGTTATITVSLVEPPAPPAPAVPAGLAPRFQEHVAPPALGNDAAEPSIGVNRHTDRAMFISYTQALRMTFLENAAPPLGPMPTSCDALWEDKSGFLTTVNTLDPILFTDDVTGRTFNSQLSGANSLFEFTDDDGENWTVGQIGAPNGGADHQTVASGPYPVGFVPAGATWPANAPKRAVYYCSQSVAGAACSRSDDGGETFGPGFAFKNTGCSAGALHGHVKVAPDGTVYVPDSSQCLLPIPGTSAEKVVAFVSGDAGQTWAARPLPESRGGAASDPSIGIATDGTLYMCYENDDSRVRAAVSKDKGRTWLYDQDIGLSQNIVQTRFPQSVAGDPDRAGCAFLGTKTNGNGNSLDFKGVWHPYVATTYDGGQSWHLVNTAPNDPIQGHGGVGPDGTNRNLLDFNDLQIDEIGRMYFALADGCTGTCAQDPSANAFEAKATVFRQTGGRTLFKAFDNAAGTQYNSTAPLRPAAACAIQAESLYTIAQARVVWNAPDTGGSTITGYDVYRATAAAGPYTLIGSTTGATQYIDRTVDPEVLEYWYRIVAKNAHGEAPVGNSILLVQSESLPEVNTCELPGQVVAIDAVGDGTADDTDIVYVAAAEPLDYEGNIVVTVKLANFTAGVAPATSFYPVLFPTQDGKYIAMDTNAPGSPATPRFVHGTYVDVANGVLAFTEVGTLDPRSEFLADGTIRHVVPKTLFRNTTPGAIIAGFDARARVGAQSASSRDTAGPASYEVRGSDICKVLPPILLGSLEASPKFGGAPLTVTFTVSGTPPAGKTLQSYTLNFGDGTAPLADQPFNGAPSVQRQHTYTDKGTYRARLTVKDNTGAVSSNAAEQTIEVNIDFLFSNGFE
ncbi:MAG TPA: PKD domain-containing protein [Candidatus Saccharimonadia bacterium]|nr:PKD domain-containing protein [Candidatus Saccharimonadia bacterium]